MRFSVEFERRDFSAPLTFPRLEFEVNRYSHAAMGGPEAASLTAYGDELALWELLEWLRAPVYVIDENGERVWWGELHEVTVRVGAIEIGLSLDRMSNRVAVAYSYVAPGSSSVGTRATTDWEQNDDSVAAYGTMELMASLSGATTEMAEAARDRILNAQQYPIPIIRAMPGKGSMSATLKCRGWWDTLAWQYYAQLAGLESHEDGSASQAVGETTDDEQAAQSLSLAVNTSWEASRIWVKVGKEGSPSDTFYARLYSDSSGAPGTLLATGSASGSELPESATWTEFELDSSVTVSYGTTYWIVLSRSGAVDADNYYTVVVDEDLGYGRGVFRLWNGASWQARSTDADMAFKLGGEWETTRQIEEAIDAEAEFITGVDLVDESGIWSSQYRSGDATLAQVVRELLEAGTDNGRQLLATVTRERELKIYEEPEADDADDATLFFLSDGQVEDRFARRVSHECPTGEWCALKDVLPPTLDVGLMADPSLFFVERAEYRPGDGTLMLEPRGAASVWELAQIGEG